MRLILGEILVVRSTTLTNIVYFISDGDGCAYLECLAELLKAFYCSAKLIEQSTMYSMLF